MIQKYQVELNQGEGEEGPFGFVLGEGGGYFFDHLETLEETLESVEACAIDGDGGLDIEEVREFLRRHLPAVMGIYARPEWLIVKSSKGDRCFSEVDAAALWLHQIAPAQVAIRILDDDYAQCPAETIVADDGASDIADWQRAIDDAIGEIVAGAGAGGYRKDAPED